jgi:hypothetical protein
VLSPPRPLCAQAAFASGVLAESQFSELESLQTPDAMNFVAEGAPPRQHAPHALATLLPPWR